MRLEPIDTVYFMMRLREQINKAPRRTLTIALLQGGGETDANVTIHYAETALAWRVGPGGLSRASDQGLLLMVAHVLYGVINGDQEAVKIRDGYNTAGGDTVGWMVLEITGSKLTKVNRRPMSVS